MCSQSVGSSSTFKTNVLAFASRSKAKTKPRRRTLACSSTRTVPICERSWTDIEPENYSSIAYPVSKQLSTLLRHGDLPREEDGAIEFLRWKDCLLNHFVHSQHWSDEMWKSKMAGGGGNKQRFQYCPDPSGQEILYLRALQGLSGRNLIDPSLQDNVSIPNDFFEYIYHIGCAINLHSIVNSGLIPGGQNVSKRQTVFFTSVDPMNKEHRDPNTIDLEAPRLAWFKQKAWKKLWNTVYWVDIKLARKDLSSIKHNRMQSSFTTHSQFILSRRLSWWKLEKSYTRKFLRHRLPPKISFKDNWMKELGSEVAGGGKDSQQTQPKTKNPIVRTVRPVKSEQPSGSLTQEIDKGVLFGCESTNVRSGRPVRSGQCIGLFTQCEEIDIDFRVSGLPHAVVKQANIRILTRSTNTVYWVDIKLQEKKLKFYQTRSNAIILYGTLPAYCIPRNFRVRELVKKIENHPHRQALQDVLQQNNADNPFSDESKAMIREMGNVELFELWETIPKVQCSECLLHWNQGIVYCTGGDLLVESESSQNVHQWRLDAFSIPHYVIRKERPRGARHGKTEAQKEHFVAHNARKRCMKKNFDGIHDRLQQDSVYRDSQRKIGWTEEKCIKMDKLAQEDTPTGHPLRSERYKKNWKISINKSGRNARTKLRSDFRTEVTIMNRLHRESAEERPEPIPFLQYQRWHSPSSSSSSSTSWWQRNENWWSS